MVFLQKFSIPHHFHNWRVIAILCFATGSMYGQQSASYDIVPEDPFYKDAFFRGTFSGGNFTAPGSEYYFDGQRIQPLSFESISNSAVSFNINSPSNPHEFVTINSLGGARFSIPPLITLSRSVSDQNGGLRITASINPIVSHLSITTPAGGQVDSCQINFATMATTANSISFDVPPCTAYGSVGVSLFARYNAFSLVDFKLPFTYITPGQDVYFDTSTGPTVGGTNLKITGYASDPQYPVGNAIRADMVLYNSNCSGSSVSISAEKITTLDNNTLAIRTPHAKKGCANVMLTFNRVPPGTGTIGITLSQPFTFRDETLVSGDFFGGAQARLGDSETGQLLDIAGGTNQTNVNSFQSMPEVFRDLDLLKAGATGASRVAFTVTESGNAYYYDVSNRSISGNYIPDCKKSFGYGECPIVSPLRRLGDDLPPAGGFATNGLSLIRTIPTERPFALGLPNFLCRNANGCTQVLYPSMAAFDANPDNLTFSDTLERRFGPRSLGMDFVIAAPDGYHNTTPAWGFVTIEQIEGVTPVAGECLFLPVDAPPFPTLATHLWLLVVDATREICNARTGSNCTDWVENPDFMCSYNVADLGAFAPFNQPADDFSPVTFVETNATTHAGTIYAANAISGGVTSFAFDPTDPFTLGTPTPITVPHTRPHYLRTIGSEFVGLFNEAPGWVTSFKSNGTSIRDLAPSSSCLNSNLATEFTAPIQSQTRFSFACPDPSAPTTQIWIRSDFDAGASAPKAAMDYAAVGAAGFQPQGAAMTPQEPPLLLGTLYVGLVQSSPAGTFDQSSHQQNLINYYNNTVVPDLATTSFTNNGQRQSALFHLSNLHNNTDKWVTDPALRMQLDSLLDSVAATLQQ